MLYFPFPFQAGLQPRDAVMLVWEVRGTDEADKTLKRVITNYKEYIETTTKGPIVERSKVTDFGGVIVKEEQKVRFKRSHFFKSLGIQTHAHETGSNVADILGSCNPSFLQCTCFKQNQSF